MFRSPWFWVTFLLVVGGVVLTAALGALYWLLAVFVVAGLAACAVFLVAAYGVGRAGSVEIPFLAEVPRSERIPVICDCDVAMGRPFRMVDDGLALLYLLGEPRVDVVCVTTTYGNGPVEATTRNARRLLDRAGCGDIPVWRGAAGPDDGPDGNEAARRLKEIVAARPGQIVLIATGTMTNLKHAAALDVDFFRRLRGLYLMGGVTEPLFWNGRRLAEINFSLDPEAAQLALYADCPVTIATGQAGLAAVLRGPQFAVLQALEDPISRLIAREIRLLFALVRLYFRDGGVGMWDSVAAMMLTQPGLFDYERVRVTSTRDDLRTGRLAVIPDHHGRVRLVRGVLDDESFIRMHFAAWHRLGQRAEKSGKAE